MIKEFEIYINYGVLGAEKRNAYTYPCPHEHSTYSEKIKVQLPENEYFKLAEDFLGRLIVESTWGWNYDIGDVLEGNERPCFYALDRDWKGHRVYLIEIDE